MVATVTGNSLGLSLTSLATLGGQGSLGTAGLGRSGEGVYVNTATGNLVVQDRDALVVSRGFDALALRTYNSQGLASDDNIDNWSNGIYAQQVRLASGTLNAANSTLVRTDRDGAQATYTYNATLSAYVSSDGDGAFDRIVYQSSQFTWTDGDSGLQERYDASGKITASIDPLGGSLTYTYIASRTPTYTGSLLTQVTSASGEKLVFTYAAGTNNLIELSTVRIDDPAQPTVTTTLSRVRYTYNNDRLETVTVDLTPDVTGDSKTYVTTYAYTDATSRRIKTITQTDGSEVNFVYTQAPAGGAYRVTEMTQTSVGGTTPVTRKTTFAYDTANRKTTVTDPLSNPTSYFYDTAGRLTSVQGPPLNGVVQTFSYAYNASGDLTSQTDAQGNVTTYGYDANGNQTSAVDALGNTVTRTFNAANKVLTETLSSVPVLVASSGVTLSGGAATKTGTTNAFDAGFRSENGYLGGASVSFSPAQANKTLIVGLNTDPSTDNAKDSIDWGIYCASNGDLLAYGNGSAKGSLGTYVAGDVLTLSYDGSTMRWFKNGVVVKTSTNVVITQPLYADASLHGAGAQVTGIYFGVQPPAAIAPITYTTSAGITLVGGTATKTGTTAVFDAGFRSNTGLTGPVAVSFSPSLANKSLAIGLNTDPATDNGRASIDFALHCTDAGALFTYQNGDNKGQIGTYVAGDVLGVAYDGASIKYYKNGVVLKTVNVAITQPLYIDSSFYSNGAQITGLSSGTDIYGVVSPPVSVTTRYVYDTSNLLRYVLGAEGRVTEYIYNLSGQQVASIDYADARYSVSTLASTVTPTITTLDTWRTALTAAQKQATVRVDTVYDFRGQVDKVIRYNSVDSAGNGVTTNASTTQYVYDQAGNLLKTIEPKGVATTGIATDFVTQYFYDGLSRVYKFIDALGVTTLTDYQDANAKTVVTLANGLATTRTYNKAGELISVLQSDGATALGTTSYAYGQDGNLRRITDPTGLSTYSLYDTGGRKVADIDGTGSLTEYVYNQNGLVVRSIRYATAVSSANLASLNSDINNNLNAVTLATVRPALNATSDRTTRLIYDKANRLVKSIDELGFVTETQYDNAGRVLAVVRYDTALPPASLSAITPATLPTDGITQPVPNAALDRRTRFFYDAEGLAVAGLDAEGYLTENQYDNAGRLVHTVRYATPTSPALWLTGTLAQLRPAANAAKDIHTWTTYNAQNQVLRSLDGEGYLTMYAYDLNGNQTLATRYNKQQVAQPNTFTSNAQLAALVPINDAQDHTSSWTYTDLNQIKTATDFQGTVTQFSYSNVGLLEKTEKAFGTAELRVLQTRYDKLGRVVGELTAEGSVALAAAVGQTQIDAVWSQYGLTHAYDAAGRRTSTTDQNGAKTLFFYNADGDLAATINALGQVTETKYNALNQAEQTTVFGGRLSAATLATLTGGQVSAISSAIAALTNAPIDARTSQTYTLRGQVASTTDARNNTNSFAYTSQGELATSSTKIDAAGNLVTTGYTYDRLGQLKQTVFDAASLNITTATDYDAFGRAITRTDGNLKSSSIVYDRLGRVVQTTDPLLINRSTTYDAFDRTLTLTDGLNNTTSFAYDKATRTVTMTTPEGIQTVTTASRHGETVILKNGNQSITTYAYDLNGRLKTRIEDEGAGKLNLITRNNYDRAGRLSDTESGGTKTAYTYDALDRVLTRRVDPSGLNLTTLYGYDPDAQGQRQTITDPAGVVTTTRFDLAGNTTEVAVDAAGLNLRTQYTYDPRGKALTVTQGAGSPTPQVTKYEYDRAGRLSRGSRDPLGMNLTVASYTYDKSDNVVNRSDGNGNLTRYAYDADNRLVYTVDPLGAVTKLEYDKEDHVTRTVAFKNFISLTGLSTAPSVADIDARVTPSTTDELTRTVYDKNGRAVFSIDALNQVTKKTYDNNGNVTALTRYAAPITLPGTLSVTNVQTAVNAIASTANDRVSKFVYDAANRQTLSVDPAGGITEISYDAAGHVTATRQYFKVLPAGSALSTIPTLVDAARDRITRYGYDAAGRQTLQVDGAGGVTETLYDQASRIIGIKQYANALPAGSALSQVSTLGDASRDHLTRYSYDTAGRQKISVDATGAITETQYDAAGNLTALKQYATVLLAGTALSQATALADAARDHLSRFGYDAAGRHIYSVDAAGAAIQTAYDAVGHVVSTRQYATALSAGAALSDIPNLANGVNKADDRITRYAYDANGRQTIEVDATNAITETVYDAAGNVTATKQYFKTLPSGNALSAVPALVDAVNDRISRHAYDAAGRQVLLIDGTGAVSETTYDAFGGIASTRQYYTLWASASVPTQAQLGSLVNADDRVTRYTYDGAGRVKTVLDALGFTESYTYDGLGNKTSFTNKKGSVSVWTYTYDAAGRLKTETSPEVSIASLGVNDGFGNLTLGGSINASIVTSLAYDAFGNITARTEASDRNEQRTTTYGYDALNRQTKVTFPKVKVYKPESAAQLAANGQSGLAVASEDDTNPLTTQTFYDVFGNAVANIDVAKGVSYKLYDAMGRVRYAVDAMGYVTAYLLNAFGEVAELTRYSATTTLANTLPTSATPAPTAATEVLNAIAAAPDLDATKHRTIITTYDAMGRVKLVTEPEVFNYDANTDTETTAGKKTENTYNAFGDLVQQAVSRTATTWTYTAHYYDKAGRQTDVVDALGNVTRYAYDAVGNLTRLSEFFNKAAPAGQNTWVNAPGAIASNPSDRITVYTYDKGNRKTREERRNVENSSIEAEANGNYTPLAGDGTVATSYGYDAVGNLTRITDANGGNTYSYYDAMGRVTAVAAPMRTSTVNGAALTPITLFKRDAHGYVIATIELANGANAAAEFTGVSTTTQIGYPATAPSDDDHRTLYKFDLLGHEIQNTDATGVSHYTSYNERGDVAKTWQGITSGAPVYENGRLKVDSTLFRAYQYDKSGRLIRTIDPAPRGKLDARMTAPQLVSSSAVQVWEFNESPQAALFGNNTVVTRWNGLIDATGDSVRLEIEYQTVSDGSWGIVGHPDRRSSPEIAAAAATEGITLSWDDYDVQDGGIAGIHALTVSQRVKGVWVVKWHGTPAEATGNAVSEAGQAVAGVIETVQQYNAFGEVIYKDKGVVADILLSGQREYFKYDNAGRLWGTNSGDGVDRVMFYDLQGNVTSVISSSGSGGANTSMASQLQASEARNLGSDRRTNLHYDAIGHLTQQVELPPVTTQDGVIARGLNVNFYVNSRATVSWAGWWTTPYENWEPGYTWTAEPNSVVVTWPDMSGLGPGDVRVRLSYQTQSVAIPPGLLDAESGIYTFPAVNHPGVPAERTWTFSSTQAAAGATLTWWDESSVDAGIEAITGLIVEKQDALGRWVTMMTPSTPGYYGDTLEVLAPRDGINVTTIQYFDPVSSTWISKSVDFVDSVRLDPSRLSLPAGTYSYRVIKTPIGQTENGVPLPSAISTVVGTATFTVGGTANRFADRPTTLPPTIHQTVDRWGNVATRSDVRNANWLTKFTYDANNQLTSQTDTQANGSGLDGGVTSYYHDKLGQLIGVKDARGNINGQRFDSGGNLIEEFHADGGRITHLYDAFGNRLSTTDAVGNETAALKADHTTAFAYDKAGRLLSTTHAPVAVFASGAPASLYDLIPFGGGALQTLVERNTYDQAGRKISQTNAANETNRYRYDLAGHVIESIDPMSNITRMIYDRFGYKVGEVDALGYAQSWTYDYFGQLTGHTDLGGAGYKYTYDNARQLTDQTSTRGQRLKYGYDIAGHNISIVDTPLEQGTNYLYDNQTTTYAYDLAGNRTREKTVQDGVVYQDNHLTYDALGRLRDVGDGRMHIGIDYDAVGNRTRISTFSYMSSSITDGPPSDRYFQYDKMNRQEVVDSIAPGVYLTDGNKSAHVFRYDKNGNRTADIFWGNSVRVTSPGHWFPSQYQADDGNWMWTQDWAPATYESYKGWVQHTYSYDLLNRLSTIRYDNTVGSDSGTVVDTRFYDAAGRLLKRGTTGLTPAINNEYIAVLNSGNEAGTLLSNVEETNAYDHLGRLTNQYKHYWAEFPYQEYVWTRHDSTAYAYDAMSNVTRLWHAQNGVTNDYAYTDYKRFDGYMADTIVGISSQLAPSNTNNVYDKNGRLVGYYNSGVPRTLVNDASGYVLQAVENGQVQRQVVVNGEVLARYGYADGAAVNDFNFSYDLSYTEGSSPRRYTVHAGETLQTIAHAAYGDATQWYLIAAANGLAGEFDVRAGQTLTLPDVPAGTHNNVDTVKPYDPSRVNGNVLPNLASGGGRANCGAYATAIVAVVVSAVLTVKFGTYTTAPAARLGNSLGQLYNMTKGRQDKFDFHGWNLAGFTAANNDFNEPISASTFNELGRSTVAHESFDWKRWRENLFVTYPVQAGVRAATFYYGSYGGAAEGFWGAVGQVAVSTAGAAATEYGRTQFYDDYKFNWRNVAAAAITATVSLELKGLELSRPWQLLADVAKGTVSQLVANRGKVDWTQVAVDAFGNVLGSGLAALMRPGTQGEVRGSDADRETSFDRGQESRLLAGETAVDYGDIYADGDGYLAASTGATRRAAAKDRLVLAPEPSVVTTGEFSGMSPEEEIAKAKELLSQLNSGAGTISGGNGLRIPSDFPVPAENLPEGGFLRGFIGGQRNVLDGPSSGFAENLGATTRGLVLSPINTLTGFAGEIGNQYGDLYNLMTRSGESYTPSSALLNGLQREGFGSTLMTMGEGVLSAPSRPIFDLLDRRYEAAGGGLGSSAAVGFGLMRSAGGQLTKFGSLDTVGTAGRNPGVYETLFEAPISGTSRGAHRTSANAYLANQLSIDSQFADLLNRELGTNVLGHMTSGRNLLNPPSTIWHHPADNPNVVQLLRSTEHKAPSLQPVLHPQGIGGYGKFYGP